MFTEPPSSAPGAHVLWSLKGYTAGFSVHPQFHYNSQNALRDGRSDVLPLPGSLGEAFPILAPPPLLAGNFAPRPPLGAGVGGSYYS